MVSMFFSVQIDLPLSWSGVCFTEICDAMGSSMCRVLRPPPWFEFRVLVSQSVAVCPLSCNMVSEYSVNLRCTEGFGSAPSVVLVSLFIRG